MPALAIPLIVKVGIPLATYAIGHVVGWFHRKHVDKKNVLRTQVAFKAGS
jgi:hypothetical protein